MAKEDEFTRGYLLCISDLVHGFGTSTQAETLFKTIGSPSAKEIRRLKLLGHDARNISLVRKYCR